MCTISQSQANGAHFFGMHTFSGSGPPYTALSSSCRSAAFLTLSPNPTRKSSSSSPSGGNPTLKLSSTKLCGPDWPLMSLIPTPLTDNQDPSPVARHRVNCCALRNFESTRAIKILPVNTF